MKQKILLPFPFKKKNNRKYRNTKTGLTINEVIEKRLALVIKFCMARNSFV